MKKYQITEMATLLDVSPSTLRNFEDKGLLFPHRVADSGYRQFDPVDLNLLFRIRGFTRCGLSLDKTAALLHTMDIGAVSAALENQSREIEREIEQLALKSRYMKHRAAHLKQAEQMTELYILDRSPALYILPFRTGERIINEKGRSQIIRHWAALKPFTESLLLFPLSSITNESFDFVCGTCIDKEYGDRLGICAQEPIRLLKPNALCAYTLIHSTTCRNKDQTTASPEVKAHMQRLLLRLKQAGYAPAGDGYGTTLHTRVSRDTYEHLSELWMPLKKN
jgi:DNA-binding transcriptional MerR regulator